MNSTGRKPLITDHQPRAAISAVLALSLLIAFNCSPGDQTSRSGVGEINVAAAANLIDAFEEVGRQFTVGTGTRVVFSFGATADLARQIENGGPFDVFASADVEHVDRLIAKGYLLADTRALYARGRLVLWARGSSDALLEIEELAAGHVKYVAIAKPDVAPYGRAALEALRALNLWQTVEPKVVYAQNVSQARQFAASGNADMAFIPLALVKTDEGRFVEVDQRLHQPIDQAMGVVASSAKTEAARAFVGFVLSSEGQSILERFGYLKP
jgi:molybdate transport system substrate-binding protein